MLSFQYRPALDGLRALAILPVLLYHADVAVASGGFLGVDLFFVLSGYLITSLLVLEHRREGAIRLRAFWLRRARRLLPALVITLLLVSLYAVSLASPDQLARIRADGLATLGYVANWWYIYGGESYFDQFNAPSPLRHTWSLGIEEQWYIFLPLVLVVALRRRDAGLRRLALASAFAALFSLFLMAALFDPSLDPSRVYYGTDTHAHGLLVGAALAFALAQAPARSLSPSRLSVLGLAGGAIFFALVIGVTDDTPWMYRGGFGLAAVASAGMINACTRPEKNLLKTSLSFGPLVYVGRISYGLYLYHWPLYVVLLPERVGLDGAGLALLRIGLTFALAVVSFHYIEMPVRRRGIEGARALGMALAGVAGAALVLVVATWGAVGEADRSTFVEADPAQSEGRLKVLVIGDSVAGSLGEFFQPEWGPGLAVSTRSMPGCGIMTGALMKPGKKSQLDLCRLWRQVFEKTVDRIRPDLALLSIGNWEQCDRVVEGELLEVGSTAWQRYFLGQLEKARATLSHRGAKVVILTRQCSKLLKIVRRRERARPGSNRAVNEVLRQFAEGNAEVGLIDLDHHLCKQGRPAPKLGGVRLYRDGVHFSKAGSRQVWKFLTPQIERVWAELADGG